MSLARVLHLTRPLVVIDTETTGARPLTDRIVEIAMVKLHPDGRRERYVRRVNPETRIPIEATAIHGITNADVEGCPPFRRLADEIVAWIGPADLCGFNIHSFDLRILQSELSRCGVAFAVNERRIVDVQVLFHRFEPRDLAAAVRFYLEKEHRGAHGAEADAEATLDVLLAQIRRYGELEPTVPALAAASQRRDDRYVDPDRKLEWRDGVACFSFGKHVGRALQDVVESDPDYIDWILNKDFPDALKEILAAARNGNYPRPVAGEDA